MLVMQNISHAAFYRGALKYMRSGCEVCTAARHLFVIYTKKGCCAAGITDGVVTGGVSLFTVKAE